MLRELFVCLRLIVRVNVSTPISNVEGVVEEREEYMRNVRRIDKMVHQMEGVFTKGQNPLIPPRTNALCNVVHTFAKCSSSARQLNGTINQDSHAWCLDLCRALTVC